MKLLPRFFLSVAYGLLAGCVNGQLTPAAEAGILAADLAVCDALIPLAGLPPGVDAAACQGEELALKAALDRVTAAPERLAPATTRRAVYRRAPRRVVGYVSGHVAGAVQGHLDAAAGKDGGA